MKKLVLSLLLTGASLFAATDLIPVGLKFRVKTPEFGGSSYIRAHIYIKNVGTETLDPGLRKYANVVGNRIVYGYVYGSPESSHALGGEIAPGETGLIAVNLPATALNHCQRIRVQIDRQQDLQDGAPYVFQNDTRTLSAREYGNWLFCLMPLPVKP